MILSVVFKINIKTSLSIGQASSGTPNTSEFLEMFSDGAKTYCNSLTLTNPFIELFL
ncbi:unnamed protein product [Meloidogyne enterolobii]|uniref:Uncharacterized protein n=1 Tax=Meloidogyne enterolobii TaxID=390850 RepID=A0ACB1A9Q2_MELEN